MAESAEFQSLFAEPLLNGVSYPSKLRGQGVPMVNMREIFAMDRIGPGEFELVPLKERELDRYLLAEGDLLFARQSLTYEGAGKCSIVANLPWPATWESHIMRVRLNENRAVPGYYYHYFRSPQGRRAVESIIQQVAAAGIRGSDLRRLRVPVPPVREQEGIAQVLGALDDKIEANRKLAATGDDLAVSLLSPFDLSVPLRLVAEQSKVSLNPQSLHDEVVAHYSLPAFDEGAGPEIVAAADVKSNKYCLRNPAVLVSKLNPRFPRIWNVADLGKNLALASTEFVVLEPTCCSTHVLWAMTRHTRFARSLQGLVAGTSGSHQRVRPVEILETLVPDPRRVPIEVQSLVDATVRQSLAASKENHSLAVLRDNLLPKLMSGQLRVREGERLVANAV